MTSRNVLNNIHSYQPPGKLTESEFIISGILTLGSTGSLPTESTPFDELIWDAFENVVLHFVRIEVFDRMLSWANEEGLKTTRGFGPGTRDGQWPMEERESMFETLPAEKGGAKLKNNGRIHPPKTFAFSLGAGSEIQQAKVLVSCGDCSSASNCPYSGTSVG